MLCFTCGCRIPFVQRYRHGASEPRGGSLFRGDLQHVASSVGGREPCVIRENWSGLTRRLKRSCSRSGPSEDTSAIDHTSVESWPRRGCRQVLSAITPCAIQSGPFIGPRQWCSFHTSSCRKIGLGIRAKRLYRDLLYRRLVTRSRSLRLWVHREHWTTPAFWNVSCVVIQWSW